MPAIPHLEKLQASDRILRDIANQLDKIASSTGDWVKNVADSAESARDLTSALDHQVKHIQTIRAAGGIVDARDIERARDLSQAMDEMAKKAQKLTGVTGFLGKGLDKVGKGLLKLWAGGASAGLDLLIKGIQRVYDLEERWAKVTGEVNMKLGKLSPSMKTFWKESRAAEGALRGLGGELGDGTKLFADFTAGFNQMNTNGFGKVGVQVARGFDVGAESTGKFLRVLDNLGFEERKKEASSFMLEIVEGADTAGVSVNALAKDFAESATFVARFGKEGAKALVKSASYLRQYNMTLQDTEKLMDKFDTFESAADSVAKLNVVFGTSINALNVMLEQDPAKRFDALRGQLLAQGKTWERMSYFERRQLESVTGLANDQLSAMLDIRSAGKDYNTFLAENEKKQRKEADAGKLMQVQLRATATTLYNFGAAADRITVAISRAIKPFTDLLGLTRSSDKPFRSFGQVMETITKRVILFFNSLAKNKDWMSFMQKLADLTKRAAVAISNYFAPDKISLRIQEASDALKTFAKVSAVILGIWAGSKAAGAVGGIATFMNNISSLRATIGMGAAARGSVNSVIGGSPALATPPGAPGTSRMAGGMSGALGGAAAGAGVGSAFGATAGGALGGGAGGAIGSIFGPVGSMVGSALGTAIGIGVQKLMESRSAKEAAASMDRLREANDAVATSDIQLRIQRLKSDGMAEAQARKSAVLDKVITSGKKDGFVVSERSKAALAEQVADFQKLGAKTGLTAEALAKLGDPKGAVYLTSQEIAGLERASREYKTTVSGLQEQSQKFLDNLFDSNQVELAKKQADAAKQEVDARVKLAEIQVKQAGEQNTWWHAVTGSAAAFTDTIGVANENSKAFAKVAAERAYAEQTATETLNRLRAQQNGVETQALELQVEQNRQARARLEIESLSKFNSSFQAMEKEAKGDVALAIQRFAQQGGPISQDTVSYVRGQQRAARGPGAPTPGTPASAQASAGTSGGSGGNITVPITVQLDGTPIQRHVIKRALTGGRP